MSNAQAMTVEEKVDIAYQASMLRRAGDAEGYDRLIRTIPMPRQSLGATGLISRIAKATLNIDYGRKGFAIIGKEREGRISYAKILMAVTTEPPMKFIVPQS